MSIINKMHQDLNSVEAEQPVISSVETDSVKQKKILILVASILVICAAVLIYLIVTPETPAQNAISIAQETKPNEVVEPNVLPVKASSQAAKSDLPIASINSASNPLYLDNQPTTFTEPVESVSTTEMPEPLELEAITVGDNDADENIMLSSQKTPQETPVTKTNSKTHQASTTAKPDTHKKAAKPTPKKVVSKPAAKPKVSSGELNIETAQLSNAQLATIYLKEANKARARGDNELAAEKWQKALNVKPDLNEVRRSLASYHYSQGDTKRATNLLKKGALISPEYSDFHLMLARMSLKAGDNQKAYLYLEQNPPEVEGHLDYYVTHAILAQKFQLYERAEELYKAMLTQRPNNGRWLMSLAISQDKQAKTEEAVTSYETALQQTDLSLKAKDYIKKRLAYLGKE